MGVVREGNREYLGWMKDGCVREGNREYLGWMKDGCCEGGKSRMFGLDERWGSGFLIQCCSRDYLDDFPAKHVQDHNFDQDRFENFQQECSRHVVFSVCTVLGCEKDRQAGGLRPFSVRGYAASNIQNLIALHHCRTLACKALVVLDQKRLWILIHFEDNNRHTNSNILINSVKKDIKELLIFIDENSIDSSSQNEDVRDLWMRYSHFREGVHHGQLGKTAQFWVKYMDKV
ncbi:hypothetical protein RRG08_039352 [Elysia crispata]|uniref:Uncharacterized protein n=1 Tax=Elysia crispata TaxID=231223 RepID=A0AAE0YR52_9GAST|nr:hypothetical protein RRG08_039352 [Elysia crispata]